MSELPKLQFVRWDQFHQMGFELSQQLYELRPDLDTIVSISRGGHVLARILSDFLKLPIFSVSIQSYTSIEQQGNVRITQELAADMSDKHILLVDEIVDSGRTLERGLEYLAGFRAASVTSVAMHVKPKATHKPDFYVTETDEWVVYPYEVRETLDALTPRWKEKGLTVQELTDTLVQGGMRREQIEVCLERS